MMRVGSVYCKGLYAGRLEETPVGYRFTYDPDYRADPAHGPVALSLPMEKAVHEAPYLFPFFVGLLAEGDLARAQCHVLKLDERDAFGRLLATAGDDSVGAVTVRPEARMPGEA